MRKFGFAVLVCTVASMVFAATGAGPAAADAAKAKNLLVMIDGTIQGRTVIGAGIIVGQGADRLYIATANHVVRQGRTVLDNVRVRFRFLPGEAFDSVVLRNFDRDLDLAMISVKGVRAHGIPVKQVPFRLLGQTKGLNRGDAVYTIGYPRGAAWRASVNPDRVSELSSSTVRFESALVAKGHSGGGLFDKDWRLIGMITADEPPDGVALRMDRIVERMRSWSFPVQLERPAPVARSTPVVSRPVPPPKPTIMDISGNWLSSLGTVLSFTTVASGQYNWVERNTLGMVTASGSATVTRNTVRMSGVTLIGLALTASLEATRDRMSGQVTFQNGITNHISAQRR